MVQVFTVTILNRLARASIDLKDGLYRTFNYPTLLRFVALQQGASTKKYAGMGRGPDKERLMRLKPGVRTGTLEPTVSNHCGLQQAVFLYTKILNKTFYLWGGIKLTFHRKAYM
jgi:hypothetical protein